MLKILGECQTIIFNEIDDKKKSLKQSTPVHLSSTRHEPASGTAGFVPTVWRLRRRRTERKKPIAILGERVLKLPGIWSAWSFTVA